MPEEWRPILGSLGRYEVSSEGRIRRFVFYVPKWKIIKGTASGYRKRYLRVCLPAHGRSKRLWPIHQLVALAFLGDRPAGYQINHKDGNPANNCVENLEWVTPRENIHHSWAKLNRKPPHQGEHTHFAKLTDADVRQIRVLRAHGGLTYAAIASEFNTKPANVWHICVGHTWKHLLPNN